MRTFKKYFEFSKLVVYLMTILVAWISYKVIGFAEIAITTQYTGSLPFLTTMISAVWAAYGTVLSFMFNKSKKENEIKLKNEFNQTSTIEDIPCEESSF